MSQTSQKRQSKKISPPAVSSTDSLSQWINDELKEGDIYSGLAAIKLDLSNRAINRIEFDRVSLTCSDMSRTTIAGFKLCDSRLSQCDLANADWHGAHIARVEMSDCRLLGLTLTESRLRDCVFSRCNGGYMRLRFASLNAVRFEECNLRDSDFQGADLSGTDFWRCDLRNSQMSGAKLRGASLLGSNIEGIAVNAKDLEGVIVDPTQAAYIAPLFGIKVVW